MTAPEVPLLEIRHPLLPVISGDMSIWVSPFIRLNDDDIPLLRDVSIFVHRLETGLFQVRTKILGGTNLGQYHATRRKSLPDVNTASEF